MADYYIQLIDRSPSLIRETPLGVYEGATPLAAVGAAKREWGLMSLPIEAFSSTPITGQGAGVIVTVTPRAHGRPLT